MEHYELIALTPEHLDELSRFFEEYDIGKARLGKFKFRKRGTKVSVETDFSPLENTIKSGVEQLTSITRNVEKIRRKGVAKALKIYRDASGITRAHLEEIQRQNKQLQDELADVKRELEECLREKGDTSRLTPKSRNVMVKSALSQVKHIEDESKDMAVLLEETKQANNAVEESASKAILKSAKESINALNEAIENVQDEVEINQNLEQTHEMPAQISAIPGAPPAPNLTKVVQYTTEDGEVIRGTPQQFASAQVTSDALKKMRDKLVKETSESIDAIQDKRREESPSGLQKNLRRELAKRRQVVQTQKKVYSPSLIDDDMSKIHTRMKFASLMSTLDSNEEPPDLYEEEYEREDTSPRTVSVVSQKEDWVYW